MEDGSMGKPLVQRRVVEIAKPESGHAHMWRSAQAKLYTLDAELQAIADRQNGYTAELTTITQERATLASTRNELVEQLRAAQSRMEDAQLAAEFAAGSPMEDKQALHLEHCRQDVSAIEAQICAHDLDYEARDRAGKDCWSQQEYLIHQQYDEAQTEHQVLLAKLHKVKAIYQDAFRKHGEEEQAAIIAELEASQEHIAEAERHLADARAEHQALQTTISPRLHLWSDLATATERQYGAYEPASTLEMLRKWRELAEHIGRYSTTIDDSFCQHITMDRIPLWICAAWCLSRSLMLSAKASRKGTRRKMSSSTSRFCG